MSIASFHQAGRGIWLFPTSSMYKPGHIGYDECVEDDLREEGHGNRDVMVERSTGPAARIRVTNNLAETCSLSQRQTGFIQKMPSHFASVDARRAEWLGKRQRLLPSRESECQLLLPFRRKVPDPAHTVQVPSWRPAGCRFPEDRREKRQLATRKC